MKTNEPVSLITLQALDSDSRVLLARGVLEYSGQLQVGKQVSPWLC